MAYRKAPEGNIGTQGSAIRCKALLLLALLISGCAAGGVFPITKPIASATPSDAPTAAAPTPVQALAASPTAGAQLNAPTAAAPTPFPEALADLFDGQRALVNGDWEAAMANFQNALARATDGETASDALLGLGEARFRSGDTGGASDALNTYLQTYPGAVRAADAHFWLAEVYRTQGAWGLAVQEYSDYLGMRPGVIDSYVQERIAQALQESGDTPGATNALVSAIAAPRASANSDLRVTLAQLYVALGQFDAALVQYDAALAQATEGWQKSRWEFLAAQALLQLDAAEAANLRLVSIVNQYPDASEALEALDRLRAANVAVADYQRGLVYYYAGRSAGAQEAFADDLKANPTHAAALYYTALAQRALGDLPAAVATFQDMVARFPENEMWAEAWFELAWTQREYGGSFEEAIATYRKFVETAPAHPRAPEALFLAARLAERLNDLALAAQLWSSIVTNYPNAENAPEAAFQAALVLYRAGDLATAAQTFAAIPPMPGTTAERRAAALLWLGKTRDRLGDTAGRDAAWAEAIAADPHGYYSIRAAELAAGKVGLFTPPPGYDFAFNEQSERAEAEAWLADRLGIANDGRLGELSPAILADGRWARGLELWRLGLYAEARSEFESLRHDHQTDALASYQLGLAFRQIGLYRLSASATRACLDLVVTDRLAVPRYFTRLRFGAYFTDLIVPIAGYYGLDPLFLLSVIRQESAFEPFAGSSAGAQGLMQIIPGTGAEIAAKLGWPNYRDGDLQRPIVSLNFGAYYLSQQLTDFDRDKFAALAAYNSGSGNAAAWKEIAPGDPDLYLEVIRIQETETYLRFIYEIYEIYKGLYGR